MSNADDDGLSGPGMRSLVAPLSAKKRRGSHKMTRTLGQRRYGDHFANADTRCPRCMEPKARAAQVCSGCAALLERRAKRSKIPAAPLLAYFESQAVVLRERYPMLTA